MNSQYPPSAPNPNTSRSAQISNAADRGSTSELRPRNRRLISTELTSTGPSAKGSSENRAVSPIPSRHPSRIVDSQRITGSTTQPVGGLARSGQDAASGARSPTAGFGKGIWDSSWTSSWTALQGLASSMLGADVIGSNNDTDAAGTERKGVAAGKKHTRGSSAAKKAPSTWGPSGTSRERGESIGVGSLADRDLAVRAMKMASVLESHEGANGGLDVNGNYKRRTSLDRPGTPSQNVEDADALVYLHHVQPSDTLAGIVLKYNCQPAVFRKANGLYPNDLIQAREVVFLPVDACAIRGRPCNPPSDSKPIDLLAPTPESEDAPSNSRTSTYGGTWGQTRQRKGNEISSLFDVHNTADMKPDGGEGGGEKPWLHVSWVLLDSSPSAKPVEIARLPRKTLGYFPPRRRKSHTNSSSISTPRDSFDVLNVPRSSQERNDSAMSTPPHQRSNVGSPSRDGSYFPAPTSNILSRENSANKPFLPPKWLRGPGGIGTFDVRSPGPAQDSLNSWAARHAPILGIGNLPSSSVVGGDAISYGFNDDLTSIAEMPRTHPTAAGSGSITPRGGGQGSGMGLEHAAAAIESWVRRLASKAAPGTPKLGLGSNNVAPVLGEGDLIELLDGAGSDDGRGFEPFGTLSSTSAMGGSSGRDDHAAPLRGRLQGTMGTKGKSD